MRWLSTLAIASVGILGSLVDAGPVFKEQSEGYYNYVERISPGSESGLKAAVKTFYEQMVAEHAGYPEYPEPMMAAGMVVDKEFWMATSGSYKKGPKLSAAYPSNFPATLKTALDQCYAEYGTHKKNSNCAEVRLLALYFEETKAVSFPVQMPIAVYGKGGVSQSVQYHHPCADDGGSSGCVSVVKAFSMNALTRRTLSSRAGKDIPIKSGKSVPKSKGSKKKTGRSVEERSI